jgi:hypothetical protein
MRFTTKLKPKSVAAQQALANGFVLDLTQGGADQHNADFKAYSG